MFKGDKMEKKCPHQVDIPHNLISEVDRVVLETGLYSDKTEFVFDAVRRLILESNKDEIDWVPPREPCEPREKKVQNVSTGFSEELYPYGKSRSIKDNKR